MLWEIITIPILWIFLRTRVYAYKVGIVMVISALSAHFSTKWIPLLYHSYIFFFIVIDGVTTERCSTLRTCYREIVNFIKVGQTLSKKIPFLAIKIYIELEQRYYCFEITKVWQCLQENCKTLWEKKNYNSICLFLKAVLESMDLSIDD